MYDSYEYANERLFGTVCRLKDGTPIYISCVGPGMIVSFSTLAKSDLHTELKNVDVSSPPLGFVQKGKEALYVSRIPKRKDWKQGLRAGNVGYVRNGHISFDVPAVDIMQAIVGVGNKTLAEGMDYIRAHKCSSVALSRHWAITSTGDIVYKWDVVGSLTRDGEFKFLPRFGYIESRFYEDVINATTQFVKTTQKAG